MILNKTINDNEKGIINDADGASFIAFAMQSCKSDNNVTHNMSWSLEFQDKGHITDEQKKELEESFVGTLSGDYPNDETAEKGTEVVAEQAAVRAIVIMGNDRTAVFTITVTTTRVSDSKQICIYEVEYAKGSVYYKKDGIYYRKN